MQISYRQSWGFLEFLAFVFAGFAVARAPKKQGIAF